MANILSTLDDPLMRRYEDAYRVARTQVRFGTIAKALGMIIAAVFVLLAISTYSEAITTRLPSSVLDTTGSAAAALGILASICLVVLGAVAGGLFFVVGIFISAQGQLLQAQLDTAVYASPFLTLAQQREILGLPEEREPQAA